MNFVTYLNTLYCNFLPHLVKVTRHYNVYGGQSWVQTREPDFNRESTGGDKHSFHICNEDLTKLASVSGSVTGSHHMYFVQPSSWLLKHPGSIVDCQWL